MAKLDNFLRYAMTMGASDLHVASGTVPMMRVQGELKPLKTAPLGPNDAAALIGEILTPEQKVYFQENLDLDFCYEVPGMGRFRSNILKHRCCFPDY
jgi:twitching motility protein PilT